VVAVFSVSPGPDGRLASFATGPDARLASFAEVVHPFDESARLRLESMPELPALLDAPLEAVVVRRRPEPDSRPEVRRLLPPLCEAFGIPEPVLHLETGDLIDDLAPDEIEAVLAHECGHVLLGHVAYRRLVDHPAVPVPVRGAIGAWVRAAELSADRAAAAYQGSPDAITRVLFRLAGAAASGAEARAFAVRVREIQAWTATPAFARLRLTVTRGS
jgi:Zn-dependent protease with chaperone function